jgi:hypothetical protein
MSISRPKSAKILNTVNNLIVTALLVVITLLSISTYTGHNIIAGYAYAGEVLGEKPKAVPFESILVTTGAAVELSPYINEISTKQLPSILETPKTVFVNSNQNITISLTDSRTINDMINRSEIDADEDDIILPSRETVISSEMRIEVIKVDKEFESIPVEIAHGSQCKLDDSMLVGTSKIVEQGVNGLRTEVYQLTYNNGVQVSRELVSNNIDRAPQDQVVAKGTQFSSTGKCVAWDAVIDELTTDPTERYWLKYVMRCESKCNDKIVSSNGAYHGLFQYDKNTFYTGGKGKDIYDGYEQVSQTLYRYRLGQQSKWPVCSAGAVRNTPEFCNAK